MLYMVRFTINIPPMLAYIPYMDSMDILVYMAEKETTFRGHRSRNNLSVHVEFLLSHPFKNSQKRVFWKSNSIWEMAHSHGRSWQQTCLWKLNNEQEGTRIPQEKNATKCHISTENMVNLSRCVFSVN